MGIKIYESNKFIKTGGTSSQYLMADGTTSTGPDTGVDVGTGTANKVAKFSDSDTITDSTITDDGTDVSITGKLGIETAAPDSPIHIEKTDTNYDVARGIHVDYTKNHTNTTGWGASLFGVRSNVYNDGVGKLTDLQAGRFVSEHIGTGISYYLLGSQSKGTHNGSGNTGVIWGAFNAGQILGTGTGTHPFLIGTNQKAELNNANATVANMAGIVSAAKTTAGTVTGRIDAAWIELDCNQGAATTVDANILYLKSDTGNLTVSGTARSIYSNSTLPSLFLGSIQSPTFNIGSEDNYLRNNSGDVELYGDAGMIITSGDGMSIEMSDVIDISGGGNIVSDSAFTAASITKAGGTSSQFLKADGSVDSTTYATTDGLWDNATGGTNYSGGNVGIGTTSPNAKLEVVGVLNSTDHTALISAEQSSLTFTSNYAGLYVANTNQTDGNYARINFGDGDDAASSAIGSKITSHSSNYSNLEFWTRGSTGFSSKMLIEENGNVGIGTTSPDVMLDVSTSTYANAFVPIQDLKYNTFDVMKLGYTGLTGSIRKGTIDTASYGFSVNTGDGTERFAIDSAGDGTFNGALTIDSDTDTILKLNNSDNGAQYVTYSRSNDRHAYVGFGGSSDNFTIMSEEAGGKIILGTAATTRVTIDSSGYVTAQERLGIGGDFTPQKALHIKNAAPVFRFEDSDITGGYLDMVKSSRNMRFDLEQDDATAATNFNFRIGGTTHLYMKNNFVGIMNDAPSEALDVTGNVLADSFAIPGGTSSRFLKADGSTDATAYNSGAGTSGRVAVYNGTNTTTDDSNLQYNFLSSTLTARNLDVAVDLNVGGDVDVTGNIECDIIQADGWTHIPQTFQANFVHSSGNGYMNLPFNSLSDTTSGGEQHFMVTPYQGYVHSVAFKNTATGSTMTATNMNFRVLRNGITIYTSSSQSFTAAARTYKGWELGSTDATFSSGNDLRFQFQCTSGFWQDTCAVVVLKCII